MSTVPGYCYYFFLLLLLFFSHLADAFIQSDLQIRKSNKNYKLKVYKYYIYTIKKMEKLKKCLLLTKATYI